MPAAAVTPAPIAYIKVVAVKKLVVGYLAWAAWSVRASSQECGRVPVAAFAILLDTLPLGRKAGGVKGVSGSFTLKKLECSKQALLL